MSKFFILFSLFVSFSFEVCIDSNVSFYQHVFPLNSSNVFFPFYSNIDFSSISSFKNVTILIHGLDRNAALYFCQGLNFSSNQAIIVPFFTNRSIDINDWTTDSYPNIGFSAFWQVSDWIEGGLDQNSGLSSFEIMDQLINFLKTKVGDEKIVLAGFSAGAQLVQRYAWASTIGNDHKVRFFVSDPSSFIYFTNDRPGEECRSLKSEAIENCQFFFSPNETNCYTYNIYKYGLSSIDSKNFYLMRAAAKSQTDTILNYANQEILYVFGADDVCNCNTINYTNSLNVCYPFSPNECMDTYPDAFENVLVTSCQAMLQGSNRLQRGLNYMAYLKTLCGEKYFNAYVIEPGMGHNSAKFFQSNFFQKYGFQRENIEISECIIEKIINK